LINLPKPSPLSVKGSADGQIRYIINYLQMLVRELEKLLGSIKDKNGDENGTAVSDISYSNSTLSIIYSDGSVKQINFE